MLRMNYGILWSILFSLFSTQGISGALWNATYEKGQVIRFGDLDVYSVGQSRPGNFSVIVIYDIRGFNISQTRVFCDRLATEYNTHVVMPDFFRGSVAPANLSLLGAWLPTVGPWSKVSIDLQTVADWLNRNYSRNQIALVGFCWGGLQIVRASANLSNRFFTGVSIHGSSITPTEVQPMKRPALFIAASNDPPLQPNISSVIEQSNPNISQQCQYKTYATMRHGFVSAGANYSNPANVQAIDDVHQTVREYFNQRRSIGSSAVSVRSFAYIPLVLIFLHLFF